MDSHAFTELRLLEVISNFDLLLSLLLVLVLLFFLSASYKKSFGLFSLLLLFFSCANKTQSVTTSICVKPLTEDKKLISFEEEHLYVETAREQVVAFIEVLKAREAHNLPPLHILLEKPMGNEPVNESRKSLDLLAGLTSFFSKANLKKTTLENVEVRYPNAMANELLQATQDFFQEEHCPLTYVIPDGKQWVLREFTFDQLFEGHKKIAAQLKTFYEQIPDTIVKKLCHNRFQNARDIYQEFIDDMESDYKSIMRFLESRSIRTPDTLYQHTRTWPRKDREHFNKILTDFFVPLFDLNALQRIFALHQDKASGDIVLIAGGAHSNRIMFSLRDTPDADALFRTGTYNIRDKIGVCERDEDVDHDRFFRKLESFVLSKQAFEKVLLEQYRSSAREYIAKTSCASFFILLLVGIYIGFC